MDLIRAAFRLTVIIALASSCSDGQRSITGEAERLGLVIRVEPGAGLADIARSLAWPSAAIPGALVIVERITSDPSERPSVDSVYSDAAGLARFSGMSAARYAIRARRIFTSDERRRGAEAFADIDELAGATSLTLIASGTSPISLPLTPVGGSTIVISQLFPAWPLSAAEQLYYYGGYFRIHNNSAAVVPLAGKLWFEAWGGWVRSPARPDGCSVFAPIERDPEGLWVLWTYRFPPTARALGPGASVLLVTDAIDHRQFGRAGFFDLSRADFEFLGTADPDNPLVPNMEAVGPQIYHGDGHGYRFRGGRQVWGLADPVNVDTVPRWVDPVVGGVFFRLPSTAILDVVRYRWDVPQFDPTVSDCPSAIASAVDATDAVWLGVVDTLAIHRRIARTLPDGRVVFQRSRNSAADWIAGPGTPGRVP